MALIQSSQNNLVCSAHRVVLRCAALPLVLTPSPASRTPHSSFSQMNPSQHLVLFPKTPEPSSLNYQVAPTEHLCSQLVGRNIHPAPRAEVEVVIAKMMVVAGTPFFQKYHITEAIQAYLALSSIVESATKDYVDLSFNEITSTTPRMTEVRFYEVARDAAGIFPPGTDLPVVCAEARKVIDDYQSSGNIVALASQMSSMQVHQMPVVSAPVNALVNNHVHNKKDCVICHVPCPLVEFSFSCKKCPNNAVCDTCMSKINQCPFCRTINADMDFHTKILNAIGGQDALQKISLPVAVGNRGRPLYMSVSMLNALNIPDISAKEFRQSWLPAIIQTIYTLRDYTPGVEHSIITGASPMWQELDGL